MISIYIDSAYGDKFNIQIESNATVYDLKIYLEMKFGIPSKNINLIFQNRDLNDSVLLSSIKYDQYPNLMIESIDISNSHELSKTKKTKLKKDNLFPDLLNITVDLINIEKLNRIPCTNFTLNYSFSKNIPVTFLTLDPSASRNALLNSATSINQIYDIMHFDRNQFCLYSTRRILYNNETLFDIGIFEQTSLRATQNIKQKCKNLKEFSVYHLNSHDNPFFIPAHENMYISELKQYISINNLNSTPDNIALFYTNILLNDDKQVSCYKMPNKSILTYSIISSGSFKLDLVYSDFIHENYPLQNKKLKIKKIKSMIENTKNIPFEEIILFFNNILIKDSEISFEDLTEKNQIEIELRTKNDPFFLIQSNENKDCFYKIDFSKGDTVLYIKKKISDSFDVLIGDQILLYNGIELNDTLLIDEYDIEYGSVLELKLIPTPPYFTLSVFYKLQEFKFDVHQRLYIRDLKKLISKKTNDKISEIEFATQPVRLNENTLISNLHNSGGLNLFVCPIFRSSSFDVNVITLNNDNFIFVVFPEMTISIFKQMLDIVLGQLHQHFSVFFNGKQVSDEKTFQYIGAKESSTLYVLQQ